MRSEQTARLSFYGRPSPGFRLDLESPAEHFGALAHTDQAEATVYLRGGVRAKVTESSSPISGSNFATVPLAILDLEARRRQLRGIFFGAESANGCDEGPFGG